MERNDQLKVKYDENNEKDHNKIDGTYGWIIVLAAFFINFISSGIFFSFGVVYVQLLDEFHESKSYTSFILSLMAGLCALAAPVASVLVKKFGCRMVTIVGSILCAISFFISAFATNVFTLILTIGVGTGFSFGLVCLGPVVIVSTYFEKYRALATGISLAGVGLGTFLTVPVVTSLSEEFGWRKLMMIFAGYVLICGLFGILFRPINLSTEEHRSPEHLDAAQRKQSKELESQQQMKKTSTESNSDSFIKRVVAVMNLSLFQDPVFVLYCLSIFLTSLGYYVPYFTLNDFALVAGLSKESGSHLLSVIGIVNTVGRVIIGYVSDQPWMNRFYLYNFCLTICGTATALSFLYTNMQTLVIYCAIFGFTSGAYVALRSVIIADLFGLENIGGAFGLALLFEGIASFIGPTLVGHLYDQTQSYAPGFLVAGVMVAASGLILFALPALQRSVMRRKLQHDTDYKIKNNRF